MTLSEAKRIDKLIYDLAFYEVTKGEMQVGMDMESAMNKYSEVSKKFNSFKKLIKSGEFTLEELEREVVRKYSATVETTQLTLSDIDKFVSEYDTNSKEKGTINKDVDILTNMFVKMLIDPKSFGLDPNSFDDSGNTLTKNPHHGLDSVKDPYDEYHDNSCYWDDEVFGDEYLDEESED